MNATRANRPTTTRGRTSVQATAVTAQFNLRGPAKCWAFLYAGVASEVIASDVPTQAQLMHSTCDAPPLQITFNTAVTTDDDELRPDKRASGAEKAVNPEVAALENVDGA
jgi:hypothetical protein